MRELTPSMWWRTELRIYLFQSRNVTLFHSLISFCNCQTVMSNAIEKNANIADIIARKASLMNRSSFQLYPMLCGVLTMVVPEIKQSLPQLSSFSPLDSACRAAPAASAGNRRGAVPGPARGWRAAETAPPWRQDFDGEGGGTEISDGSAGDRWKSVKLCTYTYICVYVSIYIHIYIYIVSEQKLGWRLVETHWNHCPTLKTSWGNANLWWSVLKLAPGAWRHWMCLEDDLAMKPPTTVDFELLLAAFDTWRCFLMFFVVCLSFITCDVWDHTKK